MGGTGDQPPSSAPPGPPPQPIINLPPRTSMDTLFNGGPSGGAFGFSPGPMTLVSSLFNENDDFKSFSQLLAGAMSSPVAAERKDAGEVGGDGGGGFKQNRPSGLAVVQSPTFTVPPGLSPAGLLDSPGFFSASQGPFGMSHQHALAQFTAQAAQANPKMYIRDENPSSASAAPAATSNTRQLQMPPHSMPDSGTSTTMKECPDDGFNWRKYGQKQVKGSEFPRSYYKCTHPNCPVKKKVERSLDDDHVVAIIYRGQHNHQPPRPNKRAKDTAQTTSSENSNMRGNFDLKEGTTCEPTAEHVSQGSSDSEEAGDRETEVEEINDMPDPKRRNTEARVSEGASSHRTAMEPRIIVQTTSEVDLLDDGYRWRKYGQKVVKGNPYPRSYYKCTTAGCNVRKHVERASTDPKAVITTYEGRHNHDVPAAKTNSHTIANNTASQLRPHNTTISEKHSISSRGIGAKEQQPVARLRLKEEQIT